MMNFLKAAVIAFGLAAPCFANNYEGTAISTPTGTATHNLSGTMKIAASAATANTPTITLDGPNKRIVWSDGVKFTTAAPNGFFDNLARIDVRSYGAKCDNSTDDTAAIQNAVNSIGANGGTVFFPIGKCKVSSAILMKSNLQLAGATLGGISAIVQTAGNTPVLQLDASGGAQATRLVIKYLILDTSTGASSHGILLKNVSQVWIDHVQVNSANQSSSATIGGVGILLGSGGVGNSNVSITNSTLGTGNLEGIECNLSQAIIISQNIVTENFGQGIYLKSCVDTLISDNLVTSNNKEGIRVQDGYSFSAGNSFSAILGNDVSVNGAAIADLTANATPGILFKGSSGQIVGNHSTLNQGQGIVVQDSSNTVVSSNLAANNSQITPNTYAGIYILSTGAGTPATRITVIGNQSYDSNTVLGSKTQAYGILTQVSGSGVLGPNTYAFNEVCGNRTSAISLNESNSSVFGNDCGGPDSTLNTLTISTKDATGYSLHLSSGVQSGGCYKFGDNTVQCTAGGGGGGGSIPGGAANQVPFQSAPGVTTFSPSFVWNNTGPGGLGLGTGSPASYIDIFTPANSQALGLNIHSANSYALSFSTSGNIQHSGNTFNMDGQQGGTLPLTKFTMANPAGSAAGAIVELIAYSSGTENTVAPSGVNQMEFGYQSYRSNTYNASHEESTNAQPVQMDIASIAQHTPTESNRAAATMASGTGTDPLASMGSVVLNNNAQTTISGNVQTDTSTINALIIKGPAIQGAGFLDSDRLSISSRWWDTAAKQTDWYLKAHALDQAGTSEFDLQMGQNAGAASTVLSISTTSTVLVKSTFTVNSVDASGYSIKTSSGINLGNGCVLFGDGTQQCSVWPPTPFYQYTSSANTGYGYPIVTLATGVFTVGGFAQNVGGVSVTTFASSGWADWPAISTPSPLLKGQWWLNSNGNYSYSPDGSAVYTVLTSTYTGAGVPGTPVNGIQYNNAGSFGGVSDFLIGTSSIVANGQFGHRFQISTYTVIGIELASSGLGCGDLLSIGTTGNRCLNTNDNLTTVPIRVHAANTVQMGFTDQGDATENNIGTGPNGAFEGPNASGEANSFTWGGNNTGMTLGGQTGGLGINTVAASVALNATLHVVSTGTTKGQDIVRIDNSVGNKIFEIQVGSTTILNGNLTVNTASLSVVISSNGYVDFTGGSAPTFSGCGTTPTVLSGSTNMRGQVTMTAGLSSACTITPASPVPNNYNCVITGGGAGTGIFFQQSGPLTGACDNATGLITCGVGTVMFWHCTGQN